MKNRNISTTIAEKVMTGVLTILMAISVTACGSTKEQTNQSNTEVTEAVVTTETESETATEEPVLFRVKVTSENGAYISEKPTDFAYGEIMLYDYGTEFNVYEVYENSEEDSIYYRVKNESGENKYIWDGDVTVID